MSAEAAVPLRARALTFDARSRRILRYALGSTLGMGVATAYAWPLSFVVPVLTLPFLAAPGGWLGFRAALGVVAGLALGCGVGLVGIKLLLPFPAAFLLVFAVLLIVLFQASQRGAQPFLVLWLLMGLLLLPLIAAIQPEIAVSVTLALIFGASVSLAIVWLAHALVPDPPSPKTKVARSAGPPKGAAKSDPRIALAQAAVVFPAFVLFNVAELAGASLILVFVGLLVLQPGSAKHLSSGVPLILGNTMGGLASVAVFELLTVAPSFPFFLLVVFFFGLAFGSRLFSDRRDAPLYGMAFSTFLLVLGTTTTSVDGDATAKVYSRIAQIGIAVVYVSVALSFVEELYKRRAAA
ncbi:MAG: DUF2955 domain-containing protein [Planctomycetota bacterium]